MGFVAMVMRTLGWGRRVCVPLFLGHTVTGRQRRETGEETRPNSPLCQIFVDLTCLIF